MRKMLAGLVLLFAPAAWAQLAWNSQVYKDANCPPTGSSCTIGPSVICLPSGAMRLCADVNGDGTADTWVGDLDGDGTVGSSDWNADGTVDEAGTKFAGAIVAQRFIADASSGSIDSDGTSSLVSSYNPSSVRVSNLAQSWSHAAMYGDPASYLAPAVFDQYLDVFLGHNIADTARNESTSNTISQCYNSTCTSNWATLCVTDPTPGTATDPDNDGTDEFKVNDVIVLTSTQKIRAHIITGITNGTGSGCPSGTKNQWTIAPGVYSDEGHAAGVSVNNVWLNYAHTTVAGSYFLGYRLGTAPRLRDGLQGPNLLRNGNADVETAGVENWSASSGTLTGNSFAVTPSTSQWVCWEGTTSACMYSLSSSSGATIDSADWITVTPGERYVLSGVLSANSGDVIALLADANYDGTVEEVGAVTIGALESSLGYYYWPLWWHATYTIPENTHRVKVRFRKVGADSRPQIDGFSLRKVTTWQSDGSAAKGVYLINDPGDRTIIYTGDSWADPAAYGASIRTGLLAAFTDRFGRDLSSQVKATGVGGYNCKDVLNHWWDMVEKYEPLYVIVSCGVNDTYGSTITETLFLAHQREIAQRARMIGAIPIFLSVPPYGNAVGSGSVYEEAHTWRDAQRRAFLNDQPLGSAAGLQIAESGDISTVGSCTSGACFQSGAYASSGAGDSQILCWTDSGTDDQFCVDSSAWSVTADVTVTPPAAGTVLCAKGDAGCGTYATGIDSNQDGTSGSWVRATGTGYAKLTGDADEDGNVDYGFTTIPGSPDKAYLYLKAYSGACPDGGACTATGIGIDNWCNNGGMWCYCNGTTWECGSSKSLEKGDFDEDGTSVIEVNGPFTNLSATSPTAFQFDANGDEIPDSELAYDGTNSGLWLKEGAGYIKFGVAAKLKVKLCGVSLDAGFFYDEDDDGTYDAADDFCWGLGGYDFDCDCNVDQFGDMLAETYDADSDSTVDAAEALAADPSDCASGAYATAIAASGNLTCSKPTLTLTFTGATAVCNADPALFKAPYDMTITAIHCAVWAATSIPLSVEECSSSIGSCAGVDGATTITCDTDGATDDGSLSNPSIDSGDWIKLNFGTATGTITGATVTIYYTTP